MSPEVTAAWIAAGVGVLTVAATAVTQYFSRRATSQDTKQQLEDQHGQQAQAFAEQRDQQAQAFAEQRDQQAQAFAEQRKQLDRTLAEQRSRTLNERFATAAGQLGGDKPPAVRLAGVYAMAVLADDWKEKRQTCVDVLCGYLRMPYEPDPGEKAPGPERLDFRASREVRHTVIRLIGDHLRSGAAVSWQGLNFDFTGVVFDGCDFGGARFPGGNVLFTGAVFSGGQNNFTHAEFSGGEVYFDGAVFSGGAVGFDDAVFSAGEVAFRGAEFSGSTVNFNRAEFCGTAVSFAGAKVSGGRVWFYRAKVSGSRVNFGDTRFLDGMRFSGGEVYFEEAEFSSGVVRFRGARFTGGAVDFRGVEFSGGTVDFTGPGDWSVPPAFRWTDTPPPGVKLPKKDDQSQT